MLRSFLLKIFLFFRKKTRLRHIFHLGSKMEQQAQTFYEQFAGQTRNDAVKELCLKLADEENKHMELMEGKLSRWKSLPLSHKILVTLDADNKLGNLFLTPPHHNAAVEEFFKYIFTLPDRFKTKVCAAHDYQYIL